MPSVINGFYSVANCFSLSPLSTRSIYMQIFHTSNKQTKVEFFYEKQRQMIGDKRRKDLLKCSLLVSVQEEDLEIPCLLEFH